MLTDSVPAGRGAPDSSAPPEESAAAGGQGGRVIRNLVSTSITQVLTWLLSSLVMLYLPGYAGDVGLGQLTLAGSYGAFYCLLVGVASGPVIVRDVARDASCDGDYLVAACIQRLSFAVVFGALTPIVVRLLNYPPILRDYIYLTVVLSSMGMALGVLDDILRGRESIPRLNVGRFWGKVATTVATIACVLLKWPLWTTIVAGALPGLIMIWIALPELRHRVPRPARRHIELARRLVIASGAFFTTELFVTLYSQGYPLIIEKFASVAAVGWYSLVLRLFGTALFIPSIISGTLFPTITRLRVTNPDIVPRMAQTLVRLVVISAIPIASILILTPGEIIKVLKYPETFLNASPVFALFGVGLILWFLSMPVGMLLMAYDRQRALSKAAGIAACLVFPLASGLVHATEVYLKNGAIGAAASHILIELFMLTCYLRALPHDLIPLRMLLRHTVFVLISALPMAVVLLLMRAYVSPLATLLAAVPMTGVFLVLCYATRCILPEDVAVVRNAIRGRRG